MLYFVIFYYKQTSKIKKEELMTYDISTIQATYRNWFSKETCPITSNKVQLKSKENRIDKTF